MSNLSEQFQAGVIGARHIDAHPSNIGRDLGDLRDLTESIRLHGIRVPVVLERHRNRFRLRDGHRRLAAARLAGVTSVPAVIHAEALDEREWLLEAIDYNTRRKGYTPDDQRRVAQQLLDLDVDRRGIAAAFGITAHALRDLLDGPKEKTPRPKKTPAVVSRRAIATAVEDWRRRDVDVATVLDELEALLTPQAAA